VSITEHNDVSKDKAPARRLEIFTGAGRRRAWTAREKAAIVAETYEDGARTSDVARRHGLTPQQLFGKRPPGAILAARGARLVMVGHG
jgi:transposase